MELRRFWAIFWRRWPLVVIPAVIVLGVALATYQSPAAVYTVGVRFIVAQEPVTTAATVQEERYYNWLTSEYVVNGLTDWVNGRNFATAVSAQLAKEGLDIPAGAIQPVADNTRSMLTLSLTAGDAEALAAIMRAAITVLVTQNAAALPQLGGETAVIVPLDEPIVNQVSAGLRAQLDLPLRVILALGAGVGLALLVEYLDPTVRTRAQVEELGLPILGDIPRYKA
ncbi:MAG: hypothetical protein KC443_11715 [Anaerolineales bacterium]|nr:hypothetical protein [Anaerolineales bacterium]